MALHADAPAIAMQVSRGVVVASIQVDLDEDVLVRFREDLLGRIQATGARGAILDVSGLETLDADEFAALRRLITMARLMGAEAVLAGLRPGVVSALIEVGAETDGVQAAISLDAAFALFGPEVEADESTDDAPDADAEGPDAPSAEAAPGGEVATTPESEW